jgi:hypothetical protein
MAVFESQISAQVTRAHKDLIRDVLGTDRAEHPSTSEGDVIRALIELGLPRLRELSPSVRCQMYALHRRGLRAASAALVPVVAGE